MAKKVIDISKYLNADAPEITIFGKSYTVKNDHKTTLLANELQREAAKKADKNGNATDIDEKLLAVFLGAGPAKEVIELLENTPNYVVNERAIMLNVMALATGEEYEDLAARFQRATR